MYAIIIIVQLGTPYYTLQQCYNNVIFFAVPNAPVIESQPVYLQERPDILAELNTSFNLSVS